VRRILSLLILSILTVTAVFSDAEEPELIFPRGSKSHTYINPFGTEAEDDRGARFLTLEGAGEYNPGSGGAYSLFTMRDRRNPEAGCWEVSVELVRGSYAVSGAGVLELHPGQTWSGTYRKSGSPKSFPGPADHDGGAEVLSFYQDGERIIRLKGKTWHRLDFVLDDILQTESPRKRAEMLMKLYQAGLYSSQITVPGFGGLGMMRYIGKTTAFPALLEGQDTLGMSMKWFTSVITFNFSHHTNFTGITLHGPFQIRAKASGDGMLSGQVEFTVEGKSGPPVSCSVEYVDLEVTGTIPSDGFYRVTVDGEVISFPFDALSPGHLNYDDIPASR